MTQPLHDKLLACPFPHEAKRGVFLEIDMDDFGFVRGACSDCGCAGPYVTLVSCEKVTDAERAEATRLWNTRAELTRNTAIVDLLAEALLKAREFVPADAIRSHRQIDQALATYRES